MHLLKILSLVTAAIAIATSSLQKRRTPIYEAGLAGSYYPPTPCWQTFNTVYQPFLAENTEMVINAKQHLVIVYSVQNSCRAEIIKELAREASGKKNYKWVKEHRYLTFLSKGILVISRISKDALKRY